MEVQRPAKCKNYNAYQLVSTAPFGTKPLPQKKCDKINATIINIAVAVLVLRRAIAQVGSHQVEPPPRPWPGWWPHRFRLRLDRLSGWPVGSGLQGHRRPGKVRRGARLGQMVPAAEIRLVEALKCAHFKISK